MREEQHEKQLPEVAEEYDVALVDEDSEMDKSRAFVVRVTGVVVVVTPVLWEVLTYLAAINGTELKLDDRILYCCLAGMASIIAFGFKKR